MGILDDAIKEHLELKRRRGADPTEIEREEREALGPVRRIAQEEPGVEPGGPLEREAASGVELAPKEAPFEDESFAGDSADEPEFEEDTASHGLVAPPQPDEYSEPLTDPGQVASDYDEAPTTVYREAAQAEHAPLEPEEAPARPFEPEDGPETAEYDVEAEHHEREHPERAEDDDMLEETPDFLQDAPEHDRLWFEQRPPRDFDFDG